MIELRKVISRLRDPLNGCPWDIKQTHTSLIPYVLEEAYEVVNAIESNDEKGMTEELGDLLLQVILHAQIAEEENRFTFDDIVKELKNKLIRRHPNIFESTSKFKGLSWSEIKMLEKEAIQSETPITDEAKRKIRQQPAMNGAIYISWKAKDLGLEWVSNDHIWDKFNEEVEELKEALLQKDMTNAEEELGDVIFTLINIARWYNLSPERGLKKTNNKFLNRLSYMESKLKGKILGQSKKQLEFLWQEAKKMMSIKKNIN
ncbi:Nucleoside triphosphate pyrophosphohydrolase MazG [Prochlorococcus sp. MIT 0601]|nr:Nucleoside triphosphate pyrophosphohydrolase MazG [Prochlorococcus sp. MIT 0601]